MALKLLELVERTTNPSSRHCPEVILSVDKRPINELFDPKLETE